MSSNGSVPYEPGTMPVTRLSYFVTSSLFIPGMLVTNGIRLYSLDRISFFFGVLKRKLDSYASHKEAACGGSVFFANLQCG
jgi:hypothetical protein